MIPPPLAAGPGARELVDRVAATPEPAVLFIGNSYSFGVPRAFAKLAAARGKNVRVGHATYGGWTLARHSTYEPTLRKIRTGKWDIIVIQEQSEIPALAPGKCAVAMFPPLRLLVELSRQHEAIPVLYQTWGRLDGDSRIKHDTFRAMNARLRAGYQAAARNGGNLVVVAVGDAWEDDPSRERLFMKDGSHPSRQGDALTAEVFFTNFFGESSDKLTDRRGSLPQKRTSVRLAIPSPRSVAMSTREPDFSKSQSAVSQPARQP